MNTKLSFFIRVIVLALVMLALSGASLANAGPALRKPLAPNAGTVTITESGGSTDVVEGGATDSYTIVLDSLPTDDVIISFNTGSQIAAISDVTFTILDWDQPKTITVTATDDAVAEGAHTGNISHSAASTDGNYNGIGIAGVTANITDDDNAGVTVTQSGGSTNVIEGGATDSYTLVLTSQPTANVTISFNTGAQIAAISDVVFTTGNWNVAKTITVTATDDAVVEGAHTGNISHSAASADGNYSGIGIASVTANITDNDAAGVTVTESGGSTNVTEGGATDSYTIVLTTQPTANVTISFNTGTQINAISDVVFTTVNWNVAQPITVTATDDAVAEGAHTGNISHSAASADGNYNGANISIASVTANITDNDSAGIYVNPTIGRTTTESSGTDTFEVKLTSKPADSVIIPVSSSDTSEGLPSTNNLTFTTVNWNTAQTVTITGVDDAVIDGDIAYTIVLDNPTTSDTNYAVINPNDVSVTNLDNDLAGITVDPDSGLLTTEQGATATFTLVLNTEPSANVKIILNSSDTTEGTVSPSQITFTPGNWFTPQAVIITGEDDDIMDGLVNYKVTATPTSNDSNYDTLPPIVVPVKNADNDTAGIAMTPTAGIKTNEGGRKALIFIVLNTKPLGKVDLTFASTNTFEGTVDRSSYTFTQSNWSTPVTLTVTGVDDLEVDGDIKYKVTMTSTSTDSDYNGISYQATITNLDGPTIEWVSPVGNLGVYVDYGPCPVFFKIRRISPERAVKVRFYRWDPSTKTYPEIGVISPGPFEEEYCLDYLNPAFNQIYAVAYASNDDITHHSPQPFIWIVRNRVFIPLASRNK